MDHLERVKALLAALPRPDQEDLTRYLHDILFTPEEAEASDVPDGNVLVGRFLRNRPPRHVASLQAEVAGRSVTFTFREERVRCGKKTCRCARGDLHGPYTYKYWKEGGRLRKAYVGRGASLRRPAASGRGGPRRSGSGASSTSPTSPA